MPFHSLPLTTKGLITLAPNKGLDYLLEALLHPEDKEFRGHVNLKTRTSLTSRPFIPSKAGAQEQTRPSSLAAEQHTHRPTATRLCDKAQWINVSRSSGAVPLRQIAVISSSSIRGPWVTTRINSAEALLSLRQGWSGTPPSTLQCDPEADRRLTF